MDFVLFSKSAMTKIQGAILALIIIVVAVAGVYYLSLPKPRPTPASTAVDLVGAVAEDLVEATVSGDGLEEIDVTLKSKSNDPLEVSIPRGTIFGAQSAGVQSMVVIEEKVLFLKSLGSVISSIIDVACASMELDVPEEDDAFTVRMVPAPEDLIKLLNVPDFSNETFRVKQFAIWTITDNPPRDEYVGLGYFGFGSGPSDAEMTRIEALFENAGISTYKYRALNPAAPTPSPTQTPTPTASPTPTPTPTPTPAPKIPILSSSNYTDSLGYFNVVGEVQNTLSSNIEYVRIVATFYDSENTVIGTDFTYTDIDILTPNQKSPFELSSYPDKINPSSYKLSVDYQVTQDQPFQGLVILSHTPSVDGSGYHKIVGEVKNNGANQATYVQVICTYYDSAGIVIGKSFTFTDPYTISVGDTAPFELSSYREFTPANYELQVQGQ